MGGVHGADPDGCRVLRRCVPGLRREEVALFAGMSIEYYTRLERRNARGVSEAVLEDISRALPLDGAEHAHAAGQAHAQPACTLSMTPIENEHADLVADVVADLGVGQS